MVSHEAAPFQIYRPKEDWGEFSLSEGMAEEEQSTEPLYTIICTAPEVWSHGPNQ